ncbi:MFS transporter [Pseudonocardia sp. GCM10023141]|uniref:MFS transporter n=1 Tax=Pseudonocardia sp. GCM10023141 TaxID=3252653 RepID=UPI003614C30A
MTSTGTTRPGAATAVTTVALGVDMFLYGSLVPLLPGLPAVAGSPAAAGLLFAGYAVAMVVATPLVGRWVDRSGARSPMLAGLVGLAVATVLFAAAADVPGTAGLVVLVLARAAQGVAAATSWTAGLALIAATHTPERRGTVMGLALSATGAGVLLGPAVSGFLAEAMGPRAPFLLVAALAAIDAVARVIWIRRTAPADAPTSLRVMARGPQAGLLIGLTALGAASIAFIEPILPLQLATLGLGSGAIGVVFGAAVLLGAVAAPLAGMLTARLGAARLAALGTLVAALGLALAGRSVVPLAIAGVVLVGVGAQLVLAPTLVLIGTLAEHIQPPAYGTAYALYNLAFTGGLALAPLAAAGAASAAGVPAATVGAAVLAAVVGVVLVVRGRGGRPGRQQGGPPDV